MLRVGGCSGRDVPAKPGACGLQMCAPGWPAAAMGECITVVAAAGAGGGGGEGGAADTAMHSLVAAAAPAGMAVAQCVAHVVVDVTGVREVEGHLLCDARVAAAYAREAYWDGKLFGPWGWRGRAEVPPFLTFLGSQTFGYTCVRP